MTRPGPRLALLAALASLAFAAALGGAAKDVPYLSGRVNDYAGLIPEDARARIEGKLKALEEATGAQVALLTVDSLDGETIEDYSMRVAETWKLGRKGVDDGVLVLVAKNDRRMRIEVGYGLEPQLTDILCSRIIDNIMRPRFRTGDFGGGIEAAADAIAGTLEGKDVVPRESVGGGSFEGPWWARLVGMTVFTIVVGVFSMIAVFGKGCMSWFLYFFLMPFYLAFPAGFLAPPVGFATFALWVVGFPLLKFFFGRCALGKGFLASHPGLLQFASSSHGSHGGGWSGGGGFSGGGGSFGGGGSSGGW